MRRKGILVYNHRYLLDSISSYVVTEKYYFVNIFLYLGVLPGTYFVTKNILKTSIQ